ncbi:hypothetical protein AB0I10_08820 [Streptomyces sp. NPDC050636]|uniref:hypothetical protein n=1 Tax=Streptomyces sp. NPDC050636 TaxID=3154510 RepID=UPI003434C45F
MRMLFELVARLLFPAHGKHRADTPPTAPLPTWPEAAPVRRLVRTTQPVIQIFDGDATATVRPYVLTAEGAGW